MHDYAALKSIAVDARPALDSVGAVLDRVVHMPSLRSSGEASPALPLRPPSSMSEDPRAMIREKSRRRCNYVLPVRAARAKAGGVRRRREDVRRRRHRVALRRVGSMSCRGRGVPGDERPSPTKTRSRPKTAHYAMDAALDAWSAQNGSVLSEMRPRLIHITQHGDDES